MSSEQQNNKLINSSLPDGIDVDLHSFRLQSPPTVFTINQDDRTIDFFHFYERGHPIYVNIPALSFSLAGKVLCHACLGIPRA